MRNSVKFITKLNTTLLISRLNLDCIEKPVCHQKRDVKMQHYHTLMMFDISKIAESKRPCYRIHLHLLST